ncbi:MAG: branched-chain amino acid ABC transporter permease [Phreatobacter sp.]
MSDDAAPLSIGRAVPRSSPATTRRALVAVLVLLLLAVPAFASPFVLDLFAQVFIASIAALALMLLTGIAGQISLGHAGLLAAGAFTASILYRELGAPFWITLPASLIAGAAIGLIFGLPSLRLRGIYLAVSTLALHFVVIYLGSEYEHSRGFSTGITLDPPVAFGYEIYGGRPWFYVLLALLAAVVFVCRNLLRSRIGRAWQAIHAKETVAEAIGVAVARYKLLAFLISSALTAFAGALLAYYQGFVSVEAFSLNLSIQYIAMIIVGGMGSLAGAVLGAAFISVMPYFIEWLIRSVPALGLDVGAASFVNYASFGVIMLVFLIFEPAGLVGIWKRVVLIFRNMPANGRKGGAP